jgi:hypothetical protein
MVSSSALDVAIGLSLVYFLFSLAISRLNETINSALNTRHQGVEKALDSLFGNGGGALSKSTILDNRLIANIQAATVSTTGSMVRSTVRLPPRRMSYLPSRALSATVLDLLAPPASVVAEQALRTLPTDGLSEAASAALEAAQARPTLENVQSLAAALPAGDPRAANVAALAAEIGKEPLERAYLSAHNLPADNPARAPLLRMLVDANGDLDRFRRSVENWYDDTMDRVSGWYKRYVQRIILALSVSIVLVLNLDTINLAQVLWRLPTERAAVAAAASGTNVTTGQTADQAVRGIDALNLPIGWTPPHAGKALSTDPRRAPSSISGWALKLVGMLLSVLALSLGAPFWFDALGKIATLRQSGPKAASGSTGG